MHYHQHRAFSILHSASKPTRSRPTSILWQSVAANSLTLIARHALRLLNLAVTSTNVRQLKLCTLEPIDSRVLCRVCPHIINIRPVPPSHTFARNQSHRISSAHKLRVMQRYPSPPRIPYAHHLVRNCVPNISRIC